MGMIISSTAMMKPEHKSGQNPSEKLGPPPAEKVGDYSLRNQVGVFINGGGCKEALADFQHCSDEAEKKKESNHQCVRMLIKCMEAHSDYYQPILAAQKSTLEVTTHAFMSLEKEEEEDGFFAFMEGGACKESYTAWYDCNRAEDAERNKDDFVTKCGKLYPIFTKCVDAHSDYYQPFLAAMKTSVDHYEKELKKVLNDQIKEN